MGLRFTEDQDKLRKPEKRKWFMKKGIILSSVILSSTAAFLKVAGDAVGKHFYKLAIERNDKTELLDHLSQKIPVDELPQLIKERLEVIKASKDKFVETYPPQDVFIQSEDNLKLHGYLFLPHPDSHRWAILVHGYMNEGSGMFYYAPDFSQHGFNILSPDLRGSGKSEGDYVGMGWVDRKDILRWINKLIQRDPAAKIVIHGVSMGGATAMMTAGENLPDNVTAIIEDCGYTSVADEFAYELKNLFNLPSFPVMQLADRAVRSQAGFSIYEASSVEQLKKARVPILFIHGSDDTYVPTEMVHKVYDAAPVEKELLIVDKAPHASSAIVAPEEYFMKIFNFIDRHMDQKRPVQSQLKKSVSG
ncbi:alpha/beta hydrolase [Sporolactobacillus sp. Y61]|uniref:Alpha/beta hydrolase n=1 Tax=Sporolactobacillus sp. Y61 TaxID=3160863 RepID=A0AAU8IDG5_9BACL|nr:alpha/beta hydrolase [Sporolactobacillus sp. THM19-2]